jgi:hypothetical protein
VGIGLYSLLEERRAPSMEEEVFSEELQCFWKRWECKNRTTLELYLGGCCDMTGCISIAQRLLPTVRRIQTFWDEDVDTLYVLENGKWESYLRKEQI